MNPQESLLQSIEKLGYRVTVGDVAAKSGLEINAAQQGLLALAAEAGGHLQVADTGEIIYLFPENFRSILLNKYWQLQLKAFGSKIWQVVFYVIRISFGIVLIILSIRNNPALFMYILQKDSQSSLNLVYRVLFLDIRVSHLLHNTYNFLCRITQPLQKLSYMFNNFMHSPFYFQRISLRLFHDHCILVL